MDKFLILNADDFGYNPQQNAAIAELLETGRITSTSVLTVAPEAEAAATLAGTQKYPVGVHWTINSDSAEARWQSLTGARSLSDAKGLRANGAALALHAKRREVYTELETQFLYLQARGCAVDHADNHCATLYGINGRRFFLDAFDLCAKYRLPFRFPKTPGFLERQIGRKLPSPLLRVQQMLVHCGEKRGVQMPDDVVSNPWNMARIQNYETLRRYYLDAVDLCLPGVTEMFLHPAQPLESAGPEWQKRVYEYRLLQSGDLLTRAEQKGVRIVSWSIFRELADG